jgi:ATP-dependent Zn protease
MTLEETAAYHEAGHAIVALSQSLPIDYVTIVPEEDDFGHVMLDGPVEENTTYTVMIMAGPLAAAFAEQIPESGDDEMDFWSPDINADCSDGRKIDEGIEALLRKDGKELGGRDEEILREVFEKIALERLCRHWGKVRRMAEALLERKRLTGAEAKAIFEETDGNG